MNSNDELELKKEFQLERIVLFSDAVFAIILTIMVIELRLPEAIREASADVFRHAFKEIIFHLLGYAISFFFVAMFWTRHVKLLGFLKDYNRGLLVMNLVFLFCVSLFPFAVSMITGFNHINSIQGRWGFNIYICIIFLSMISFTALTGYLVKHKHTLCYYPDQLEDQLKWKITRVNYYLIPAILVLLVIINYIGVLPQFSVFLMAIYGIVLGRFRKYYYPKSVADNEPVFFRWASKRKKRPVQISEPATE